MSLNTCSAGSFSYKDLILRKSSYSVTCSVVSQLFILQLYVLVVNFNPFHPWEWLASALKTFLSFSNWLFVLPFLGVIFAQSLICARDYVFKSSYCSTRFQKMVSVFSFHNLMLVVLHVLVGGVLNWICLRLGAGFYKELLEECPGGYCLVEGSFYLILSGFWTGFYFFSRVYMGGKHLSFPVVQQRKVLQFKSCFFSLFKECLLRSLWPCLSFVILYYLFGEKLCLNFKYFFGLMSKDCNDKVLIYLYLWGLTSLYFFNMHLMSLFFNLFLTEPVEFPLEKASERILTLQESLNLSTLPIIQNLACLDLFLLAQQNSFRRKMFFSLSQPGGHPHNWNLLVEHFLKLLNEYICCINKSTELEAKKPAKLNVISTQQSNKFGNLRSMSSSYLEPLDSVTITHKPLPSIIPSNFIIKIRQKILNFHETLKQVLGINFLFGELPHAGIQKCLANGQLIIWTTQGMADLVCSSLKEDPYGIVQKDLPILITTLVQLKVTLEKLNKVTSLTRRVAGNEDFNYKMKGALTLAVKRSLFTITQSFYQYFNELSLSKEVQVQLQHFIVRN